MNVLGIVLTPGHLIVGAILVVAYDALWTWVFNNDTSDWWFERVQGWLKLAIYAGFVGLTVLVVYMPWPWNLVLVAAVAVCAISVYMWLKHRQTKITQKRGSK